MSKRADMKVGGIEASMSDDGNVRGSFQADSVVEIRHFEKKESDGTERGCHEFNIVELEGHEGTTLSLFVSTDSLGDLIEQAQEVLDAIETTRFAEAQEAQRS